MSTSRQAAFVPPPALPQPPAQRRPVTFVSSLLHAPPSFLAFVLFMALFTKSSLHIVPEGHVGVYWRGGRLLEKHTTPGLRSRIPMLDSQESLQVTSLTDTLANLSCITQGGVEITFNSISVISRLKPEFVYQTVLNNGINFRQILLLNTVQHAVTEMCNSHSLQDLYIDRFHEIDELLRSSLQASCQTSAPGFEVLAVQASNPRIPELIIASYVALEQARIKVMVAAEQLRVVAMEVEIEHTRAVAEGERQAAVNAIRRSQLLADRQSDQQQELVLNDIFTAKQKAVVDAEVYRMERESAANVLMLTPEFLQLAWTKAVSNNTKLYFGHNLPDMDARLVFHMEEVD